MKSTYIYEMVYPFDQEHEEEFIKAYKRYFNTTDEYTLPAKELKEYHDGEKVYKYYPYEIPFKIEGNEVYSYIKENQWIKVGEMTDKDAEKVNTHTSYLKIFQNIYKDVWDGEITKEEDDPFFAITVKVKM